MPRSSLAVSLAVMCALGVSLWATAAPGGESVTFKSADSSTNASIPATLYRPSGTGPFPGVVLLHDCGGLHPYQADWAVWLQNLGYVAILPDSLSPRNLTTACAGKRSRSVTTPSTVWGRWHIYGAGPMSSLPKSR